MGANLLLAYIPAAKITKQRRRVLHRLVDKLRDADVNCEEILLVSAERDVRRMLHEHVDLLPANAWEHRDVVQMALPHMPYPQLFTGGPPWGDSPSELFGPICCLGYLQTISTQLRRWAVEDERFRKTGTRPRQSL